MKAGNMATARIFAPLYTKIVAHTKEPLLWKGGYVAPLFKKGRMACPSSYRSIIISNFSAKIYHSSLRKHLVDVWASSIQNLQMGGRPKSGTDNAHLWLQAHESWAAFHGLVNGYVFFDLKSAFYMVLRQALTEVPDQDDFTFHALVRLGIQPQEVAKLLETAQADNATAGLSQHADYLIKDALTNTFFQVRGSQEVVKTHRGTRPGDPLGGHPFQPCHGTGAQRGCG